MCLQNNINFLSFTSHDVRLQETTGLILVDSKDRRARGERKREERERVRQENETEENEVAVK